MKGRVRCHLEVTLEWRTKRELLCYVLLERAGERRLLLSQQKKKSRRGGTPSGHREPNAWQFSL